MSATLTVKDLGCAIHGHDVVDKLSFSVPAAGTCAVVGVNGSGKTTLLRTLTGIIKPATGTVLIDDHSVHALKSAERARKISFVGQEEGLQPDLTVFEAVSLGRLPHVKPWEVGGKKTREAVHDALSATGLTFLAQRLTGELSGGQRRMSLVARALVQNTDIIVLDEPANHLDVRHQLLLLDVLKQSGKTIICSMHDLDLAHAHFDSIVLVRPSEMVTAGPATEVLTRDNIANHFGVLSVSVDPPDCQHSHIIIDSIYRGDQE